MSEGETFICDYLESKNIKYRKEEIIESLIDDSKNYRRADFYLPKYKVYIEYFGQWNNDKQKPRYQEKRNCYIENKIPCIILYPENLGIIDYIFHNRLIYVLCRYKMEKELNRYRFDIFKQFRIENIIITLIFAVLLGLLWPWTKDNKVLVFISFGVIIYQLYLIYKSVYLIYKGKDPIRMKYFEK